MILNASLYKLDITNECKKINAKVKFLKTNQIYLRDKCC